MMRAHSRALRVVFTVWLASVLPPDGLFEPRTARAASLEYEVKAAFLFNFTKFVQWPSSATTDTAFTICVLGDDPFGASLDQIVQGEAVNGRKILVQRLQTEEKFCQLEYFGRNAPTPANRPEFGVLTVGEEDAFLRHGGAIAFVIEQGRVRFDISLRAANAAALKMNSKLLAVARSVER